MIRTRGSIGGLVVYILLFIFMYGPGVSFINPPDMRGFVGGVLDGIFMLPIFLLEVWDKYIHNAGAVSSMFRSLKISYQFGYLIGAMLLWGTIIFVVPVRRRVH